MARYLENKVERDQSILEEQKFETFSISKQQKPMVRLFCSNTLEPKQCRYPYGYEL